MSRAIAPLAAFGTLLLATPALADRAGDAPIKAPNNLASHHIAFTLPGDVWKQKVGALAGNPAFGRYSLHRRLPDGSTCTLTADVLAKASSRRLVERRRTVTLRPGSDFPEVLRVRTRGRNGPVTWWTGTMESYDAAAAGVQLLPARLRTAQRRYLHYEVRMIHPRPSGGEDPCAALARTTGPRVARTIARTMRIAAGPPVAEPPFAIA